MVKIEGNKYYCEWCGNKITHEKKTAGKPRDFGPNPQARSSGHSRVTSALTCPRCGRYVSQRKADGGK